MQGREDLTLDHAIERAAAAGTLVRHEVVSVFLELLLLAGFPLNLGVSGESSVALVDLDGDNALEIVAAAGDGRVYAFHRDGTPVAGFPVSADPIPAVDPADPSNHLSSPAYLSGDVVPSPDGFVGSLAVGLKHSGKGLSGC